MGKMVGTSRVMIGTSRVVERREGSSATVPGRSLITERMAPTVRMVPRTYEVACRRHLGVVRRVHARSFESWLEWGAGESVERSVT
jgi:hypothetical protein